MRLEILTKTGNVVGRTHLDCHFRFRGGTLVNVEQIEVPLDRYTGELVTSCALTNPDTGYYQVIKLKQHLRFSNDDGPFYFAPGTLALK